VAGLVATIRDPGRQESGVFVGNSSVPIKQVYAYIASRWKLYFILIGVTALSGLLAIGTALWYPTFLIRTYGMSPLEVGFYYGTIMLVCGTAGTLAGGWLSGYLQRRGNVDANLKIMFFATVLKALPLVIGPLMPTATLALSFVAIGTLIGQASQGVILTAIQDVTPNRLRGQVTALALLAVNLIGLGLGSSIIAGLTDFVFRDEQALRYSIALTGAVFLPIMALMLAGGMGIYRREMASMERSR
jgi:MFS family permease